MLQNHLLLCTYKNVARQLVIDFELAIALLFEAKSNFIASFPLEEEIMFYVHFFTYQFQY